ncbi:MAG: ABC transporter permease subunit [Candidatus Puniceispirillaceae bacterium]
MKITATGTSSAPLPETALWFLAGLAGLVGMGAIIMPERFALIMASPFTGGDAVAAAINTGIDSFVALFKPALRAVAAGLDWAVRSLQAALHATPWPFIVIMVIWLALRLRGPGLAILCGSAVLYMALSGYWLKSMNTLSMVGVAVPLALAVGFGLGVLGAKSRRANAVLQPTLDLMQTIPTFAYLAPLVVLFGFGPVPGVLASMIYAAPPMTRNVLLGLRSVPQELREVSAMSGTTAWQRFWFIELPCAKHQILVGINQLVLASLSMVIIAAVIGGFDDIGREVLVATNKGSARFGQALAAGIVIVLLAVVIDRLTRAAANRSQTGKTSLPIWWHFGGLAAVFALTLFLKPYSDALAAVSAVFFRLAEMAVNGWLQDFISTHGMTLDSIKNTALVYLLLPLRIGLTKAVLPFTWGFTFTPLMQTIYLLAVVGGTAWLALRGRSTAASLVITVGLIAYCGFTYLPWWVVFTGVSWLAWRHAGWRFAMAAAGMMLLITLTGHWQGALYSVYLCTAAILVCLIIGCPLGILAAKSDIMSAILRPVNDTLQSIPLYIFLIPAVALFQVNEFSALVAIVLYAIVPLIRYTEHGLRHVPPTLVEAARANGCSPLQRLVLIELPVARPAILLGLNQTVLFALAMLIIAVLVGARGLAEQVNIGLRDADTGLGMTAGLSMAFIAIMADRILRGYASSLGTADIRD